MSYLQFMLTKMPGLVLQEQMDTGFQWQWETWVATLLGIAASAILFLVGYTRTVGAHRERVKAANVEVEKILLKRFVLESYRPNTNEVARLLEGKARDYGVKTRHLMSSEQVLTMIFTRIIENDFITAKQRSKILERISPPFEEAEESPIEEARVSELPPPQEDLYTRTLIPLAGALVASVAGAAFPLYLFLSPNAEDSTSRAFAPVLIVFAIGLALTIGIFLMFRLREWQEEPSAVSAARSTDNLEREVAEAVVESSAELILARPNASFDFEAVVDGRKILLEVKGWNGPIPVSLIRHTAEVLSQAVKAQGATEGIIVTRARARLYLPQAALRDQQLRFMTVRELRDYLAHDQPSSTNGESRP